MDSLGIIFGGVADGVQMLKDLKSSWGEYKLTIPTSQGQGQVSTEIQELAEKYIEVYDIMIEMLDGTIQFVETAKAEMEQLEEEMVETIG